MNYADYRALLRQAATGTALVALAVTGSTAPTAASTSTASVISSSVNVSNSAGNNAASNSGAPGASLTSNYVARIAGVRADMARAVSRGEVSARQAESFIAKMEKAIRQ